MSYPFVACVVATEALVVALLWIALRVSMPRVARPLIACVGLSGAWGAWVLVVVLHGPISMLVLTIAVFALASVATATAIHLATRNEEENNGGDTGGGTGSRPADPRDGGGDEPLWWPEFEREVAAYAAREREREPVKC